MSRSGWLGVLVAAILLSTVAAGFGAERNRPAAIASALNLHEVDWSDVTLPGAACGASHPIRVRDGHASISPVPQRFSKDSFYGKRAVNVDSDWDPVVFGDLTRGGGSDAGIVVSCNNGGGTADGALLYSWVVFSGAHGRLSPIGVVTPRVQSPRELPTLLEITIEPGAVVAHESFYGATDPTCCASGRATTVWTYANGALRPGTPTITSTPSPSTG
jgi:hypothetical protein